MIDFDNYRVEDLPELTAQEKAQPYASYYTRGRLNPRPDLLAAIQPGQAMDPADAVMPESFAPMLLDPASPDPRSGYCLLPNGAAYSCTVIKMPGLTLDMVKWWMPWIMGDHMRYKIWHPGSHVEHYPGLAVEDVGGGMADINLGDPYTYQELGFPGDPTLINPKIAYIASTHGKIRLHTEPADTPNGRFTMVHVTRYIEGGLEYWSFAWTGLYIENGKTVMKIAPGEVITEESGRHFVSHLAHEYTTYAHILPELYAAYGQDPILPPLPLPERLRRV
jgi:hypothetical protein